jgi:hypothetical protein
MQFANLHCPKLIYQPIGVVRLFICKKKNDAFLKLNLIIKRCRLLGF